jgi:hypothetical protein
MNIVKYKLGCGLPILSSLTTHLSGFYHAPEFRISPEDVLPGFPGVLLAALQR